ncbi:transposase [Leuconostoc lactis]|uniref:transposase n=1 Tax=Leuconostoc lactis TaxID=1246 RepID=UPI00114274BD|nr:transposase [Leuconostoc lactis]
MTTKQFHIRHPAQIWQWEQALKAGCLKPDKQRRTRNMTKQDDDKIKALEAENELLRIQVAYLEKLAALDQKKKKLQTKKKRS